jgi:hypothetical protein
VRETNVEERKPIEKDHYEAGKSEEEVSIIYLRRGRKASELGRT